MAWDKNGPPMTRDVSEEFDRLLDSFLERCRKGENPSVEEYASEHPELAEKIRAYFPTLQVMRQARTGDTNSAAVAPAVVPAGDLGEFRLIREIGRGGMG